MSLVGPRPCLPSQTKLINLRENLGLYNFKPGITGLSQINKIDMSDPQKLSQNDSKMYENFNLFYYFKYLIFTLLGQGVGDNVKKNKIIKK